MRGALWAPRHRESVGGGVRVLGRYEKLKGVGIVFLGDGGILENINAINIFLLFKYVKVLFIDNGNE